jgi:sugar phosphate isomerase/epimerase
MLARLGFRHFAYDWRAKDIPTFEAEIESLQRHGIELTAWWFPLAADDPLAKKTLETFKRHGVHPQLWVTSTRKEPQIPDMPKTEAEWEKLSPEQLNALLTKMWRADMPKTPPEQAARVKEEAERIAALVHLAAPYGTPVELYNHNGWFGMVENQLAIIEQLKRLGVTDVGMVYNFSHARDAVHDDTVQFPALWKQMKAHVVTVNITGTHLDLTPIIYPSQGDRELAMMRTIQDSGWSGRIGVIAEKGGDAEVTLKNYLIGLDWLAAELTHPGSGGTRPFPSSSNTP